MTQSNAQQYDIVIVGGGMAGGVLGCALKDSGLKILLLDALPPPQAPVGDLHPRVVALTASNVRLLQALGVWQAMSPQRVQPFVGMRVWDGDGTGDLQLATLEQSEPLGFMVENDAVVAAAFSHYGAGNLQWRAEVRVAALAQETAGWRISLQSGECFTARLLIGADGAGSLVRHLTNLPLRAQETRQVAIVAEVQLGAPHDAIAHQAFLELGPLALLPLPGSHCCSLVWSVTPERAEILKALPDEAFRAALEQASGEQLGGIVAVGPRFALPILDQHAERYVAPGVALIADAAHVIHPLAGQGINLGMLDAAVLAEEILAANERGEDWAGVPVLLRYQQRRRGHNAFMVQLMRLFRRVFEVQHPLWRLVRNAGMKTLNQHAYLKDMLVRQAKGEFDDLPRWSKR